MGLYIVAVYKIAEAEMPPTYKEFVGLEEAKEYYKKMKENKFVADVRIYMRTPY